MKKTFSFIIFTFILLLCCYPQGQQSTQSPSPQSQTGGLKYILLRSFNNGNSMVLANIADFSTLITDYKINHVFYNETNFFIQSSPLLVPVSIASNGYRTIADYQRGEQIGYNNGSSYYYAVENRLTSQDEVDYFRQERFFSPEDYRQAQREGFVRSNTSSRINRISGIIKKADLERNIYFANAIIYLMFYQQTDLVRSFLQNRDVVALTLPFARNTSRNGNIIVEFRTGYYYINLDISNLGINKDAIFYYACKFAQYLNYTDYQTVYSRNNQFTIKNSETIAINELNYMSYQECLNDINAMMGRR